MERLFGLWNYLNFNNFCFMGFEGMNELTLYTDGLLDVLPFVGIASIYSSKCYQTSRSGLQTSW
jgi:hypothetical protein